MIMDKLENLQKYKGSINGLQKVLDFMKEQRLNDLPEGKFIISGEEVYGTVSRYVPEDRSVRRLEGHKRYLDIQCILEGKEEIGYVPAEKLELLEAYNPDKDLMFFRNAEDETMLRLVPGMFAVFYPEDAHRPCCTTGEDCTVHKIVFKVRVDSI